MGKGTGNREQGTGNREQGTGNREQGEKAIVEVGCVPAPIKVRLRPLG
jgi:hypothetical protein